MRRRRVQGVSLRQVARELDVAPTLLWEWARKQNGGEPEPAGGSGSPGETLEDEVKRLRREVVTLRQEREFAKKAAAFFLKESL
jgi:transposase